MSKVRGLEHFSNYFKTYEDDYVIIGGSAAEVMLSDNDLSFRVTEDVDIVLLTNSSKVFTQKISEYIAAGGYEGKEAVSDKQYYRFSKPADQSFPEIVELFARNETKLELFENQHIIPIRSDDVEKLSAILLDEEYFSLIKSNCIKSELGFSIITPECTICLKARAFREMTDRKASGIKEDSKKIKKHRNDVVRIAQILREENKVTLGKQASSDIKNILSEIESNVSEKDIKNLLGGAALSKDDLLSVLKGAFELK